MNFPLHKMLPRTNQSLPGMEHTIHVGTFRRDEIRMTTTNSVLYHSDLFRIQRYSSITPTTPKPRLFIHKAITPNQQRHPLHSTPLHLNHTFVPLLPPFSPIFSHHSLNQYPPPSPLHSILPVITPHPLTNPNHTNPLTPSIHPSTTEQKTNEEQIQKKRTSQQPSPYPCSRSSS